MEDIVEHFGSGFLQLLSGSVMLTLIYAFVKEEGVFFEILQQYLYQICG